MKLKEFGPPGGGACVPHAPLRSATAMNIFFYQDSIPVGYVHPNGVCNNGFPLIMDPRGIHDNDRLLSQPPPPPLVMTNHSIEYNL